MGTETPLFMQTLHMYGRDQSQHGNPSPYNQSASIALYVRKYLIIGDARRQLMLCSSNYIDCSPVSEVSQSGNDEPFLVKAFVNPSGDLRKSRHVS